MPWREKATTPGYHCFRAAPIGGLSRRQGGGRDNGKKELPLRSVGGCSLGVALDPAEPYTPQAAGGEHAGGSLELGGA
jgi:hypothetical protein